MVLSKCNLPSRSLLIMLRGFAICTPNLELVGRQLSSLVVTSGNYLIMTFAARDSSLITELVKAIVSQTMASQKFCFSLCSQPRKISLQPWHNSLSISFNSCPYVTAVGATERISPEVATNFSGGGFSRYFDTPSYQAEAVKKYVTSLGSKYEGLYK